MTDTNEEKKIEVEGEDIVAHLMTKYGTDSALKTIKEYAGKQGGKYKWKTGKILMVQSPVAVKNDKFIYSEGYGFICRIKEIDKDDLVANIENRPVLTEVQLGELLGQLQAAIPDWNPLSDPGAKILEGLIINVDAPPFKDKETGEDKVKVRFAIERDNTYKKKIAEARELDEIYKFKQKKKLEAEGKKSSVSSIKVEDTVLVPKTEA